VAAVPAGGGDRDSSMTPVTFTLDGKPASKGSTQAIHDSKGKVHVVPMSSRLKRWEEEVRWCAAMAGADLLTGPVQVEVIFVLAAPKKAQAEGPCCSRPDLDKMLRALLDGLTAVCFQDDAQVTSVVAQKIYGPEPCTRVTVKPQGA
jgi:crossover junction endodeoxyribonuclease RusA